MIKQANTGWLFYKDYYQNINFGADNQDTQSKQRFQRKNETIFNAQIDTELAESFVLGKQKITLVTTYPGVLIGSGYTHETGLLGEIKIGFFFDHTSGLPILPGSSVKGTLRSAFQGKGAAYIQYLIQEHFQWNIEEDSSTLETRIFEGDRTQSMYAQDIFYDAIPTGGTQLLSNDFITPHHEQFQDPTPLQFLKVLPEIEYTFSFDLKDDKWLTADQKHQLFRQILLDLGIGAKTNVGYGALREK